MNTQLTIIGTITTPFQDRSQAPKQGTEGGVEATITLDPAYRDALDGLDVGRRIVLLTWFDRSDRSVLRVHPRGITTRPKRGVFATRSPDRPNPIGLHEVTITAIHANAEPPTLTLEPLEVLDNTPLVDIKTALRG